MSDLHNSQFILKGEFPMPDTNVNNVNSNGIALFSAEGNMLRVGFKNDLLILTVVPKVMEEGRARWPKEFGKSAMLRPHVCASLYKTATEALVPAIAARTDLPGYVVVPTNRDLTNLAGFGYKDGRATFNIFMGIDASRKCGDVTTFNFDTTPVITNYDPTTGHYEMVEAQGQLYVILWLLEACSKLLSGAPGQSAKMANNFNTNQMISYLRAIATKLGATPSQYGNFNGYKDDGSSNEPMSWGGAENGQTMPSMNTDVQQLSSLESLMGDVAPVTTTMAPLKEA